MGTARAAEGVGELTRVQRVMTAVRLVAIPFAAVQILTFYRTYPPGTDAVAWAAVAVLAITTPLVHLGVRGRRGRPPDDEAVRRWSVAGLVADATAAMLLVLAHTFDPETAVWALLYLIPLEGALLFQLRGALWSWAGVTVAYTAREVYGALVWDVDFLAVSVSYRMGIGLLMAAVVGVTTQRLVAERDRLRALTADLLAQGEELRTATAALRATRDAQAEFIAVTNHELRTPLTAVRGFARTLASRWHQMDEDARLAAVGSIDTQSARLEALVTDVLTVSAMHAGHVATAPRPLVLRDWLQDAARLADVDAVIVCRPDLLVLADSTRLRQVLVNLLTNARKYGEPPVEVHARLVGDRVEVAVRDHGLGVPPAFRPRMFEEFTQASIGASRTAEGYGLGLAIVRYLVGVLGGSVRYDDHPDGGAVFTLDLPAETADGEVASSEVASSEVASPEVASPEGASPDAGDGPGSSEDEPGPDAGEGAQGRATR